jgi:hypothetical protein
MLALEVSSVRYDSGTQTAPSNPRGWVLAGAGARLDSVGNGRVGDPRAEVIDLARSARSRQLSLLRGGLLPYRRDLDLLMLPGTCS